MRILYIANVRMPTEKAHGLQIMKMCEAWSDNGHEVVLMAPARFNYIKADPFDFYSARRNFCIKKIFTLDFLRWSNKKWAFWMENLSFALNVAAKACFGKNDVIFSRDFWSAYLLSLLGKKVIYEIHDSPPKNFIILHAFKKIDKFISTNRYKAEELINNFGVQKEKMFVAPNGVDVGLFRATRDKDFCRDRVGLPQDKKIILYTGHLYSWKGADILLEAALKIKRDDAVTVFVGGVPEDTIRFRSRAGFQNNIKILGHQEYKKIPDYLGAADVLVLPNTAKEQISLKETSPIKLFEYMAAGRPIVASDIPSVREVVGEREAVFFEPDDADDLKDKIEKVLDNYDDFLPLAEHAKKIAGRHSWDARACSILDFIIGGPRGFRGRKKILFIAGARPNFMKISALTRAAHRFKDKIDISLIHTGQHYDDELSKIFFEEFNMPAPFANLGVGSGERTTQIEKTIDLLAPYLERMKPDLVVVVGDVNSTVAAARAAAQNGIPVAHVEAGLRSFNERMAEEANRIETDRLSALLFATEQSALDNLKKENIGGRVHLAGNVMIDTLLFFADTADKSGALERFGLTKEGYALATLHRAENVDDPDCLRELISTLNEIHAVTPVICPLHPRTLKVLGTMDTKPQFKIIPAQSYFDFLKLQKEAKFILTDSGGIQEEATILDVSCLTLRTETERPLTCELGTNEVVGVEKNKILEAARRAGVGNWKKRKGKIPLWDGKAAETIMEIICQYLGV